MAESTIPRPAFGAAYQFAKGFPGLSTDSLDVEAGRKSSQEMFTVSKVLEKHKNLVHKDISIPGVEKLDSHSPTLALFETHGVTNRKRAAILYVHGGGQVVGDRFHALEVVFDTVCPLNDDIVFASVEYRCAPEHPAPAAAYDCYAGLVYLFEHAEELRIDTSRILVYGISGGGGLAAATCFLARKLSYPQVCGQLLCIPMLDDRDHWTSHTQFESGTIWPGKVNQQAWDMILGQNRKDSSIDEVSCPGRATDLSNLPPTFIDVGECEVFRDSAIDFASRIWKSGGSAELHVWPGLYHGGTLFESEVPVSKQAQAMQRSFMERAMNWKSGSYDPARDMAKATL